MKSAINIKAAADYFIKIGGYPFVKIQEIAKNFKVVPNKSLTLQFPKSELFLNKSLIMHFIRGGVC